MAKKINDYLTIVDDSDLLRFTSAERSRSLDRSSKDLTGTVESSGGGKVPNVVPGSPDDDDSHTEIG